MEHHNWSSHSVSDNWTLSRLGTVESEKLSLPWICRKRTHPLRSSYCTARMGSCMREAMGRNLTSMKTREKNGPPLFWVGFDCEMELGWCCLNSHRCGHLKGSPSEQFHRRFLLTSFLPCKSSLRTLVRLNERTNKGNISYSYTTFETSGFGTVVGAFRQEKWGGSFETSTKT